MASSRVDNGARIVDYTRWREVPALSPAWNEWSAGDELPLADTPAGIQH